MILHGNQKPNIQKKNHPSCINTLSNMMIMIRLVITYNVLLHIKLIAHTLLVRREFNNIKFFVHFNYTFQSMIVVFIIGIYA